MNASTLRFDKWPQVVVLLGFSVVLVVAATLYIRQLSVEKEHRRLIEQRAIQAAAETRRVLAVQRSDPPSANSQQASASGAEAAAAKAAALAAAEQ